MSERLALSWSGGKDSALALHALRAEHGLEPEVLITTVTEQYERISMHGVRRSLLERQAAALGIALVAIEIPPQCSNDVYEAQMARAFASGPLEDIDVVAFGDLFLEEVRAYREERLTTAGRRALFPLWSRDTAELARTFVAEEFEAILVCVDPRQLDPSFAGRAFDERLLEDLPPRVDPCGENGEFHTFVHAGPIFERRIPIEIGEVSLREGFAFCDISSTSKVSAVKQLVVDITTADATQNRLGRYKVSERRQDGSLVLVPETIDEVTADTAEHPLNGDEFLEALDRLSAAASQQGG